MAAFKLTRLICPLCGFVMDAHIPDEPTKDELKAIKLCPCGWMMEDRTEKEAREAKEKEMASEFYVIKKRQGNEEIVLQKGVSFAKRGLKFNAYLNKETGESFVIDPKTGLAIVTGYFTMGSAPRHLSNIKIDCYINLQNDPRYLKQVDHYNDLLNAKGGAHDGSRREGDTGIY